MLREKPIKETPIVVFDTETTGLSPDSYIVEIGAVKVVGSRIVDSFCCLVRPPLPIPSNVVQIHGIDNRMVKDAPSFCEVAGRFLEFIRDALLVAHNAPFDMKILTTNLLRVGRPLPENPVLDTCRTIRNLFPGLPSYSLKSLARFWRSPYGGFHRASSDAKHTAYIFLCAMNKCGISQHAPVEELLKTFGPPLYFSRFAKLYKPKAPKDTMDVIVRAIETGKLLEIGYENGELKRRVVPLNLFSNHSRWYLRAQCVVDGRERLFRMDRIKWVRPVEERCGILSWEHL